MPAKKSTATLTPSAAAPTQATAPKRAAATKQAATTKRVPATKPVAANKQPTTKPAAAKQAARLPPPERRAVDEESSFLFTPQTFAYFDAARRHPHDAEWFDSNRARWEAHVEVPFTHLILELKRELEPLLPGFTFSPRKLSRPLVRKGGEPIIKPNAYAQFSEPSESMFDTNPGFYISLGADEALIACGIYDISSRQMRALRPAFIGQAEHIRSLLADRTLRRHWKSPEGTVLSGERYTRFPKEFDEHGPGAEFFWQRRWILARHLTRDEVCAPSFVTTTVAAFKSAVPWLEWTRRTVGVWKRPKPSERDPEWL